jgi:hypothetical protein
MPQNDEINKDNFLSSKLIMLIRHLVINYICYQLKLVVITILVQIIYLNNHIIF